MANDPKYVKLADRLVRGNVTDLRSGFSIAGLDVQEFPEQPAQQTFVRQAIRAGKVEEASKDEFEAVSADDVDLYAAQGFEVERPKIKATWQEGAAHAVASHHRARVHEVRGLVGGDPNAHHGSSKTRREALLKQQEAIEKNGAEASTSERFETTTGVGSEGARAAAKQGHPAARSGKKQKADDPDDVDTVAGGATAGNPGAQATQGGPAAE